MSHIIGSIQLYDCMDRIIIAIRVTDYDLPEDAPDRTRSWRVDVEGTGETDHSTWLRDAFVAAAEQL